MSSSARFDLRASSHQLQPPPSHASMSSDGGAFANAENLEHCARYLNQTLVTFGFPASLDLFATDPVLPLPSLPRLAAASRLCIHFGRGGLFAYDFRGLRDLFILSPFLKKQIFEANSSIVLLYSYLLNFSPLYLSIYIFHCLYLGCHLRFVRVFFPAIILLFIQ
ncbi:Afadin/alpha-actinin-binding protein [Zea mays]|uniref:Afadin/alpha-actinin-binding protein n=1 Tax=Zea mays TaxID=4577 RepID=A0A1D6Q0E1_MAIZE|nr:Afadin/alpha-actinin-binding protein [Zea mays]